MKENTGCHIRFNYIFQNVLYRCLLASVRLDSYVNIFNVEFVGSLCEVSCALPLLIHCCHRNIFRIVMSPCRITVSLYHCFVVVLYRVILFYHIQ